ncbi:MAG: cytochrome c biogenesis protein CcsA [Bacteroidaceae bacterium]|nr:cytochrome c biogenesis protein CcsA [Bacteroidaceae bacterium]
MREQIVTGMWTKPWKYKEGAVICLGLLCVGLFLQYTIGPVDWGLMERPFNWTLLIVFSALIILGHVLSSQYYVFEWLVKPTAAVPTLISAVVLMIVMGVTPQVPAGVSPTDAVGVTRMLGFWPFVLILVYAMYQLGLTVMTTMSRWRMGAPLWRALLFGSVHLGLWIALVCATLGSGEMRRLRMTAQQGNVEWRAVDERQRIVGLPIAVELHKFGIDEYAPEMVVVDKYTGDVSEDTGWEIAAFDTIDYASRVEEDSVVTYVPSSLYGAVPAMLVGAKKDGMKRAGWISCGNFMSPFQALNLDEHFAVIMPQRAPKQYYSIVDVYTQDERSFHDTIKVNHPLRVDDWWIYQLSFDQTKGRWSDISVLEIVRDPWLPAVYVGFVMLLFAAVLLFVPRNNVGIWRSGISVSLIVVVTFIFLYCTLVSMGYFERKMMPALRSVWFAPHVVVYMVGYSCLALATVVALMRRYALADILVRPGLALLTVGMLFGAFWAKEAWGTYWSWDPKETWAAITWTLYILYFHVRASRPKSHGLMTLVLVVSFISLQMCWWGINYLPSAQATSVHTYIN